jgi:hypothetical protein
MIIFALQFNKDKSVMLIKMVKREGGLTRIKISDVFDPG